MQNTANIPRCTPTTASGKLPFSDKNPSTDKACVANVYNIGNYYNFLAATAGSDNHAALNNTNTLNSICPKGWRLPPYDGNKSYDALIRTAYSITTTVSDTRILTSPLSFIFSGWNQQMYPINAINNRGSGGYYWSSTIANPTYGRHLDIVSGSINPKNLHPVTFGFSIRCVSR